MALTDEQRQRYSRNILIRDIGEEGQEKLLSSRILVIGAGGLGSPNILYLSACGIGTLGIADYDVVDISNLQRQVIHWSADVGRPKIESAKEKAVKINPDVNIITYKEKLTKGNIEKIIKEYDFIIECTDNFAAKFLINDACVLNKKPYSHCGVLMFHGQTITYTPGTACLRCMFSSPPPSGVSPSSSDVGIFGTAAGTFGTIQATEAVKYLIGKGSLLTNKLFYFDTFHFDVNTVSLEPNSECPVCGKNPVITDLSGFAE
ncbi:MAG: HesA/MoeB/ThiF family protein [Spirochaetes bacterium]|nr:HesA/MoeB/ThiF family protein [Spirochaetota bacterium]